MSVDLVKQQFNNKAFNQDFENNILKQREEQHKAEIEKLAKLNMAIPPKKLKDYTFIELLYEWKNSINGTIDDMLHVRFNNILNNENRIIFLGFTVLSFSICIIIFIALIKSLSGNSRNINEYHIYAE